MGAVSPMDASTGRHRSCCSSGSPLQSSIAAARPRLFPLAEIRQVIAVEFDQVEGVEENAIIVVPVTDAVERRYPVRTARDRLSVDDAGPGAQLGDRLDDERESVGQVIAGPAIELHPFAVLAGDDPKTVVLDFVQPLLARRRLRSIDGEARRNAPSRQGAETR